MTSPISDPTDAERPPSCQLAKRKRFIAAATELLIRC